MGKGAFRGSLRFFAAPFLASAEPEPVRRCTRLAPQAREGLPTPGTAPLDRTMSSYFPRKPRFSGAAKGRETSTGLYEMTVENPSRCQVVYSYLLGNRAAMILWNRRGFGGELEFFAESRNFFRRGAVRVRLQAAHAVRRSGRVAYQTGLCSVADVHVRLSLTHRTDALAAGRRLEKKGTDFRFFLSGLLSGILLCSDYQSRIPPPNFPKDAYIFV